MLQCGTIYHLVKSPTYWLTIQHGKKKEGNAARYVMRSQAIKILQVSLSDFSHLCCIQDPNQQLELQHI
ncbi:hypothetical protein V6Z11_D10G072400 [Gossypium hirsutum]